MAREQMNVVFVGHVDHGKSTILGRMLADTGSLPDGKLERVKKKCEKESKTFEYAFLLDALKDEQSQGVTIDSARCFFKTKKRDYIIIDAPGHIEFLKNMVSGAARAEAAILVIAADEGIQENSKRHGYLLSMLGVKQVIVCVNKMDLVDYDQQVFENIKKDYTKFLSKINIKPKSFIPVSGLKGDNVAAEKGQLAWFKGASVLAALDSFEKEEAATNKPFRMPVQDVYKFTKQGDNRRIVAGRVESGQAKVGNKVVFLPSNKRSEIKSVEEFNSYKSKIDGSLTSPRSQDGNAARRKISAGKSVGVTLTEQVYVGRGEVMCKDNGHLPKVSSTLGANIFWMGKESLRPGKEYTLKIHTAKVPVKVKEIINVLDASNLSTSKDSEVKRHEAAKVILKCMSPVPFDLYSELQKTSRFVVIDNYDIAGGGIVSELVKDEQYEARERVFLREKKWYKSSVGFKERTIRYSQIPRLVLITGASGVDKVSIAKQLERMLFDQGRKVYFLGIGNLLRGLDADVDRTKRKEHVRRLGEVAHILLDSGMIVAATASDLSEEELKLIRTINGSEATYLVNVGENMLDSDLVDITLNPSAGAEANAAKLAEFLKFKGAIWGV